MNCCTVTMVARTSGVAATDTRAASAQRDIFAANRRTSAACVTAVIEMSPLQYNQRASTGR